MKQFKHKTTGTIVKENNFGIYSSEAVQLPASMVENSCDWQEIVEKKREYEILSVIGTKNHIEGHILTTVKAKLLGYVNLDMHAANTIHWGIHSVKRLSDGEIFTVGDSVSATDNIFYENKVRSSEKSGRWIDGFYNTKIERFEVVEDILVTYYLAGYSSYGQPINSVKKLPVKQKLFTSHDRVDIYEGQSWWYVALEKLHLGVRKTDTLVYRGEGKSTVLKFACLELAEKWLEENKQLVFTTDDGVKVFEGDNYWAVNPKTKSLWEGVCQKATNKNKGNGYFSTKEKALDWTILNTPILSIADVATVFTSAVQYSTYKQDYGERAKMLRQMVQNKLTQYNK